MSKKKQSRKHPQYETLEAASHGLGIEIEVLRFCKTRGCPAFRANGRVDGDEVMEWMKNNEAELVKAAGTLSLKERKLLEEIRKIVEDTRRLEIANNTKERNLVLRLSVMEAIDKTQAQVDAITEAKLVNEWPHEVAGMDVAQAREYGRKLKDEMMEEIRKLAKLWDF